MKQTRVSRVVERKSLDEAPPRLGTKEWCPLLAETQRKILFALALVTIKFLNMNFGFRRN